MLRIAPHPFRIVPQGLLLRAADYAAILEAKEVLEAAAKEAESIVKQAQESAALERQKGYDDGLKSGQAQASQQMVETVAKSAEYIASFEQKLIHIIMDSLRSILGEMEPSERVTRVASKALTIMRDQKHVVLEVCPQEIDILRAGVKALIQDHPGVDFIEVKSQARMQPGDCILRTPIGTVETGIATQLAAIKAALEVALKDK